ncbi:DUF1569 domain-containing protein [Flavobacterium sp. ANB]|uniref:DUF1569 domain-containing protein n=1 Tax=unclassified Flavobacterium TaxID=196869 RepID=UPI0012B8CC11|nr:MULTISPECIES: DUF1569 domain-containing protein [unclassified Flavobacterium]MBF4516074.1 DUF1569 domain-containing protein [Flavobacterium sp. ANB]MTD69076.1 DUF1569 domain-containing protein [Flavobacterium sp. LC2016-13]
MKNIFSKDDSIEFIQRINILKPDSKALWGKMNVAQMLAHCNVAFEMVYDNIHPKPGIFMKMILRLLIKNKVVNEKAYGRNGETAPQFIIKDDRNFEIEKNRLIGYINKTQQLGESAFDGKESHSFGKLTSKEWNNMFSKHLEHHLSQFGV